MRILSIVLLSLILIGLSAFSVPRGTFALQTTAQQPLQASTLPYTWTVSRGSSASYRIPLSPQFVAYRFYPNGTVSYDGFSVRAPAARWGSLAVNMTLPFTSLHYNSTVVEYVLNMTVLGNTLSLVTSYRQISGTDNMLVSFSGTLSASGLISQSFSGSGRKIWQNQTLTWGAAGYDWSDLKGMSSSFDNRTSTVSWFVPGSFNIDPVTIATDTVNGLSLTNQRSVFATSTGSIFLVYADSVNYNYAASTDGGVTWTTTIIGAGTFSPTMWFDGTYVYLVVPGSSGGVCGSSIRQFCLNVGTVSGSTITFGGWQTISSGLALCSSCNGSLPSVTLDSSGGIWIVGGNSSYIGVAHCTCTGQATWANATGFPKIIGHGLSGNPVVSVVPLTSGKVTAVYGISGSDLNSITWSGSAFGSAAATADVLSPTQGFSPVAVADDVYVLEQINSPTRSIKADTYHSFTNSWDTSVLLDDRSSIAAGRIDPVNSYDQTSQTFYAFWSHGQGVLWYATLPLTGQWSSAQQFIAGENNFVVSSGDLATSYYAAPTASFLVGRDTVPVFWEVAQSGSSCPCNIRYQGLLINAPSSLGQQPPTASSASAPFAFNTTQVPFQILGLRFNLTLPAQLVNTPALLLLPIFPVVVVLSSSEWKSALIEKRKRRQSRRSSIVS